MSISSYGARTGLRRYGVGGIVTGPVFGAFGDRGPVAARGGRPLRSASFVFDPAA